MAPGSALIAGFGKCCASTTARAEFCMPVSILMVLARSSPERNACANTYPIPKPRLCSKTMERIKFRLLIERSMWLLEAEIDPQINATKRTERLGVTDDTRLLVAGYLVLRNNPKTTGKSTTCSVDSTKSADFTATILPAYLVTSRGVINTAAIVDAVVIKIDSAKSAFAMSVTKFDAVPPGAQPTKINPDAISGGKLKNFALNTADKGIIRYWATKPSRT